MDMEKWFMVMVHPMKDIGVKEIKMEKEYISIKKGIDLMVHGITEH